MSTVVFDLEKFRELYPAFSDEEKVTDAQLENAFDLACEVIGNDDGCAVPYDPEAVPAVKTRETLLFLLTCHIATMQYLWDADQVAAVSAATQGSTSATFAINPNAKEWWDNTKCGAQAWIILRNYGGGAYYFGAEYVHIGG